MKSAPGTEQLLSELELATRWGVTQRTIRRWRTAGAVPPYLEIGRAGGYGRGVMYRLDDVINYENSKRVETQKNDD